MGRSRTPFGTRISHLVDALREVVEAAEAYRLHSTPIDDRYIPDEIRFMHARNAARTLLAQRTGEEPV